MDKKKISYAEAYTSFIKYCSKKESAGFDYLVKVFSDDGTEQEFLIEFNKNENFNVEEYYKKIKGKA